MIGEKMVELYKPDFGELWFRQQMMSNEQTMAYNHAYGGTIPFPRERWTAWYDRWIINHDNQRFYRYISVNGSFVGEAAYHLDGERQIYIADVIIHAPFRGNGYGRTGLLLLCGTAKGNGIRELYDDITIDNSAIALFLKCGFVEVLRTSEYVSVKKLL